MSLLKKAERYARKVENASLSRRARLFTPETREQAQEDYPEVSSDLDAIHLALQKNLARKQGVSQISSDGKITPGNTSRIKNISTGIPGLDREIGGFGQLNLITGSPGSGKTIFGMQFLMHGIEKGEPGLYISFEERKEKREKITDDIEDAYQKALAERGLVDLS